MTLAQKQHIYTSMANYIYTKTNENGNCVFSLDFLGFEAKDISAEIDEYNILILSGKRGEKEHSRKIDLRSCERTVDFDNISVEVYGGLVTVTIPPKKEARKKIKII